MFMLLCRLFKCTLRSFYCIVLLLRSDVAGFIVVKEKCHSGHHTSAAASENPDFNQKHLIRIISHSFLSIVFKVHNNIRGLGGHEHLGWLI